MVNWYKKIVIPRLLNSVMGSEKFEKIRREVLTEASGVVLEIGVGSGYNFPFYKNILKLYALEPAEELIDTAKTRANSLSFPIEFLNKEAENIPLPDHSIDTVVSTWTLCSVADPKKVLSEIARVLKPQGKFIFVDHGASPNFIVRMAQIIFTSVGKYFMGNCHCDRKIEKLITGAGFDVKNVKHPQESFAPLVYNYQGIATPKL